MLLRVANRLLSASRCAARSKVPALTVAGTAISMPSCRGRSVVWMRVVLFALAAWLPG